MKVSIVTPCYNEKESIEQIVEVVRNAPLENREIIVLTITQTTGRKLC
jgi:glycosyltransferase involved in cell wall biosynthesis